MATAMATPPTLVPSPQRMNSSSRPPSDAASDSASSSPGHSDRTDRSLSLSRNGDLQSSGSLRSEEYRQLFRLPLEQALVQDFNCALQENILLQGHMYLFDDYICFYSNIFGFETKKIIPFNDVTAVRRAKTAGIFPNAIEIVAAGKKHFFASFLSRDEAFKIIVDGWAQHDNAAKGIAYQQDFKSETSSQSNGVFPVDKVTNPEFPVTDFGSDERDLDSPITVDIMLLRSPEDENARATTLEAPSIIEEIQDIAVDPDCSTSTLALGWKEEPSDAPRIPKYYTKVAESKFPLKVEEFFNLFVSDDSVGFVESFHKSCGDKDLRCTSWSPHDKFWNIREVSFQHPIKLYFGAKCGGCKETQKYRVYRNSQLVVETSQEVSDVPYADYFTVKGLWDVQKDGDTYQECCILRVYIHVDFCKKTMWKGKIEQSTLEECREAYAIWIDLACELLKQKNIKRSDEGPVPNANQNTKVGQAGHASIQELSERLNENSESPATMNAVAEPSFSSQQVRSQGNWPGANTVVSLSRAVAIKFRSSLRSQGNLQLFLVITLCFILLLMQLSIVVLLSRPQQVHVLPQPHQATSNEFVGRGERVREAMAWLEKRIHLLKDEMLAVESHLERMRHEHVSLKAQLEDLNRLLNWR